MSARLDFWFDFASTYSYPAAVRIGALAAHADVRVRFRPFLLGPIFQAQGWTTSPFNLYPAKGRHMWRDLERLCADLECAVPAAPILFPKTACWRRASRWRRSTTAGARLFASRCSAHNSATAGGSTMPARSARCLQACRSTRNPCSPRAGSEAIKARLRAQTEEAQRRGLFGAPSFTTADGELFWGNDRLEPALRWASRHRAR